MTAGRGPILSPLSSLSTGGCGLRDSARGENLASWPRGSDRQREEREAAATALEAADVRKNVGLWRERPAGRARKKREALAQADAAPTFRTVPRDPSLRRRNREREAARQQCRAGTRKGTTRQQCFAGTRSEAIAVARREEGADPPRRKNDLPSREDVWKPRKVGAGGNASPHYVLGLLAGSAPSAATGAARDGQGETTPSLPPSSRGHGSGSARRSRNDIPWPTPPSGPRRSGHWTCKRRSGCSKFRRRWFDCRSTPEFAPS